MQLEQMGYNIGIRLVDEFCAKNRGARCRNFRETMETVARVRRCPRVCMHACMHACLASHETAGTPAGSWLAHSQFRLLLGTLCVFQFVAFARANVILTHAGRVPNVSRRASSCRWLECRHNSLQSEVRVPRSFFLSHRKIAPLVRRKRHPRELNAFRHSAMRSASLPPPAGYPTTRWQIGWNSRPRTLICDILTSCAVSSAAHSRWCVCCRVLQKP